MSIVVLVVVVITLTNYANSQLFLTENLNSNVLLSVHPPYIVEGLAFSVDIQCTFKIDTMPSMASILSIMIAYSNKTDQPEFSYMASVNAIEGHAHNLSNDLEIVSGFIDNSGESKLHMIFRYPETSLIGLYMCEVTGFDQIGKPVSILSTLNVVTSKITELFDSIHGAKSCIDSQADYIETLISLMHKVYPTLDTNYFPAIVYNGHDYYLSHGLTYFNRSEMQSKCKVFGGYLLELDTHDEFSFIRDYLIKLGISGTTWTGVTDEEQEGVWINEHNSSFSPSFDWAPGKPASGRSGNCLCFYYPVNLYIADCICNHYQATLSDYQYICEVPRKVC